MPALISISYYKQLGQGYDYIYITYGSESYSKRPRRRCDVSLVKLILYVVHNVSVTGLVRGFRDFDINGTYAIDYTVSSTHGF